MPNPDSLTIEGQIERAKRDFPHGAWRRGNDEGVYYVPVTEAVRDDMLGVDGMRGFGYLPLHASCPDADSFCVNGRIPCFDADSADQLCPTCHGTGEGDSIVRRIKAGMWPE